MENPNTISYCQNCSKPFDTLPRKKYCSGRCVRLASYRKNKEKVIRRVMKWQAENKELVKKYNKKAIGKYMKSEKGKIAIKKYYYINKKKCNCRTDTEVILNKSSYTHIGQDKYIKTDLLKPIKICKSCGSIDNLEIHHEIYPTNRQGVVQALLNKRIYYLCFNCHRSIKRPSKQKDLNNR